MPQFYTDPVDTVIISATLEGRNLLARIKFGSQLLFRTVGWQLGRGGYNYANPVKVTPVVDTATQSVGYIEVLSNSFDAGDKIVLNGVPFEYNVSWNAGPSIPVTVTNILAAVDDSSDPRVKNLVQGSVDPNNPNRMMFKSLVYGDVLGGRQYSFLPTAVDVTSQTITVPNHGFPDAMQFELDSTISVPGGTSAGASYYVANATRDTFQISSTLNTPTLVTLTTPGTGTMSIIPTGNLYPINNNETAGLGSTTNFLVTPMSMATSLTLIAPAYPVPPSLGTFTLPDGAIENPTPSSVSFVMQLPDGPVGMNAYGEIGVYAEVLESDHPLETGRRCLFAYGHFPIQAKTDRSLFSYRVIINFG